MTDLARTRYLLVVDVDHAEGHPPAIEHVAATLLRRTDGIALNDRTGHQAPAAWDIRPAVVDVQPAPIP